MKLLMRRLKTEKKNHDKIDKQIGPTEESLDEEDSDQIECDLYNLVDFMKIADITTDKSIVIENHKKTFSIRQLYRKKKEITKLVSEFPRFFDVDGLVSHSSQPFLKFTRLKLNISCRLMKTTLSCFH